MTKFIDGRFKGHAGLELLWKIETGGLEKSDWECIAKRIADKIKFKEVHGIPRGGIPFAEALQPHATPLSRRILIVDDVFTTGTSMNAKLAEMGRTGVTGIVLYARNDTPNWIMPIFELNSFFWD